jgi:hypothetical protein
MVSVRPKGFCCPFLSNRNTDDARLRVTMNGSGADKSGLRTKVHCVKDYHAPRGTVESRQSKIE